MIAPRAILLIGTHVAALLLGYELHNGLVYQPHLKKDAQAVARTGIAARRIEGTTTQIATEARDALDNKKETERVVTRSIVKAIPVYLPASRPQEGTQGGTSGEALGSGHPALYLPVGFGRLHDYAALGVDPPVPAPSGEPLAAPSGIGLSALAETLAGNYGVCRQDAAEVEAWRGWYRKEAAAWPVTSK